MLKIPMQGVRYDKLTRLIVNIYTILIIRVAAMLLGR